MKRIFAALVTFIIMANIVSAQSRTGLPAQIVLGTTETIKSTELNETRTLNVYLPKGYGGRADTSHYPVIYLLDGGEEEDFIHVCGVVQFLSGIVDTIPRCIIVGIVNTDRGRDLTFPSTVAVPEGMKAIPTAGGSAKFISFIEKELQPYVTKKYKTDGRRMLIGQSLGGLLATQVLAEKPTLFTHYLIVDPSLWWDNESLLQKLGGVKSKNQVAAKRNIFLAVGSEGDRMVGDVKKLSQLLLKADEQNNHIELVQMPEENHLTILHNAVYKGLEVLFAK